MHRRDVTAKGMPTTPKESISEVKTTVDRSDQHIVVTNAPQEISMHQNS